MPTVEPVLLIFPSHLGVPLHYSVHGYQLSLSETQRRRGPSQEDADIRHQQEISLWLGSDFIGAGKGKATLDCVFLNTA